MSDKTYTITELAHEFEVTPRAIRFYEDKGLLHPGRQGMMRVYARRDRARLQLILRGKRLGFSLAEIREMIDLYDVGDGRIEQMKLTLKRSQERLSALEQQKRDIDDAIHQLRQDVRIIDDFLKVKERNRDAPSFKEFVQGRGAQLAEVAE
ncbi:MerR family DNA-binding transcriptional regulator [Ferrovibrio sp.]|uniref:MerR family transcriptional regulator n=1 Tax=Ferrovibrio sp. TaxID=1917215 RepID=UPI00311FB0FA